MRTIVTGATGLIGRRLLEKLARPVVILSHHATQARKIFPEDEIYEWRAEAGLPPLAALAGADSIFHLAGEPVAAGRWTEERKRRIRDSRVLGTQNLIAGLAAQNIRPKVLVCASAIGYYGDRGDEELDETSPGGREDFLAEICAQWEEQALVAERWGIRVVCVRLGIVLASSGGALDKMLPAFRLGLGGKLGTGRQWMSWIHLEDSVGLLLHAQDREELHGPMNAVAPQPVSNADFTRALGQALHRPTLLPLPRFALRLALGQMSQMLTASQRVRPKVAQDTGYRFLYPELEGSLTAALEPPSQDPATE
jgi:uncharacterized protein (TIGR01777 family)